MFQKQHIKPKNLLKDNNFKNPPIDPTIIAENKEFTVLYADFEFPFNNMYSSFFDFNKRTIFINKNTPSIHITFSIAYELGLYLFFLKIKMILIIKICCYFQILFLRDFSKQHNKKNY